MSITESEAPAKLSARQHLVKFLRDKLAPVSEHDSTAELLRKARSFNNSSDDIDVAVRILNGGDGDGEDVAAVGNAFIRRARRSGSDPLIDSYIRQVETDEQRAAAERHDAQQQVAQHIEQREAAEEEAEIEATREHFNLWWDSRLALALGDGSDGGGSEDTTRHPTFTLLIDSIAEALGENKAALCKEIEAAKKYAEKYADELVVAFGKELKAYFAEVETTVRTHFHTTEKRMEQGTQRLAGIEGKLDAMYATVDDLNKRFHELEVDYLDQREKAEKQRAEQTKLLSDRLTVVERGSDDLKREVADVQRLNDRLDDRFDALQSDYRRQQQDDEQEHAEQTKTLSDRLTTIEQQSGDLKREINDGDKRLSDLEETYWSNREKDQRQRAEQISSNNEKIAGFAEQVADFAHELKEIRRDLKRATDMTQEIHQMELRLDERRIAADKAKRGARGEVGPTGPQGERGPAGKDGHAVVLKTKKWKTNDAEFLLREILSDGSRMPAANLRPMIEGNFQPLFERLLPELDQRYESMVEDMIAKAMRRYA